MEAEPANTEESTLGEVTVEGKVEGSPFFEE